MDLRERVEAIVGKRVVTIDEIPAAGGYTPALRRLATMADGTTAFVKAAVDDLTAGWVRAEQWSYESLGDVPFMPRYLGSDGEVLVLEDLTAGHWPTPWRPGDIARTIATLATVAAHSPPPGAVDLETAGAPSLRLWRTVAADPSGLLSLGICTSEWLDRNIDAIVEAESRATLDGDALVHYDVRSDNLCLLDDRVVLVDWNNTLRGRADFDVTCLAESIAFETGESPESILPDADPLLVTMLAGYFAWSAGQPPIPHAPGVRPIQRQQLGVCLPWMTRLLGL
jgi:hypothetical protein